jgi:Glutamate synthase domain 2
MDLAQRYYSTLNRLTKWRNVFAGWQLGTRSKDDPECQAVKNHREVTILLRVETTAISKILIDKGICTLEEYQQASIDEAELLSKDYEKKFPGMKAFDDGIQYDIRAAETMKDWRP